MPARTLWTALAALLIAAPGRADTYPRQPGVDAVHYVFRLALEDSSNKIAGETTITFRLAQGVREVALDLASAVGDKGMTVAAVKVGGRSVAFKHTADRLTLPLHVPAAANEEVQAVVTYSGVPANGLRLIQNIHGERSMFSENWPNRDSDRSLKPR